MDTDVDPFVLGVGCAFGLKSWLHGSKGSACIRFCNLDEFDVEAKFEGNFRTPEVGRIFCIWVGVEFRPLGRCKDGDDTSGGCRRTRGWLLGREIMINVSTILEPTTFSKNAWELSGKSVERDDEGTDIALFVK